MEPNPYRVIGKGESFLFFFYDYDFALFNSANLAKLSSMLLISSLIVSFLPSISSSLSFNSSFLSAIALSASRISRFSSRTLAGNDSRSTINLRFFSSSSAITSYLDFVSPMFFPPVVLVASNMCEH